MSRPPVEGTQGYSAEAPDLLQRYERMRFEDAHAGVFDLIPPGPLDVLDIGAGTGRDAAWFAARGDRVTAIEPTREMREGGMKLHADVPINWIDDSLPDLASVRGKTFDLLWMSAVWMHFFAAERATMMAVVSRLIRPGGALMISLRHGPLPEGRRMFEVSADETIAQAREHKLDLIRSGDFPTPYAPDVTWSRLWFGRSV